MNVCFCYVYVVVLFSLVLCPYIKSPVNISVKLISLLLLPFFCLQICSGVRLKWLLEVPGMCQHGQWDCFYIFAIYVFFLDAALNLNNITHTVEYTINVYFPWLFSELRLETEEIQTSFSFFRKEVKLSIIVHIFLISSWHRLKETDLSILWGWMMQNENFGVFQTLAETFESGVFTAGKMKDIIGNIWGTERRQANSKKNWMILVYTEPEGLPICLND